MLAPPITGIETVSERCRADELMVRTVPAPSAESSCSNGRSCAPAIEAVTKSTSHATLRPERALKDANGLLPKNPVQRFESPYFSIFDRRFLRPFGYPARQIKRCSSLPATYDRTSGYTSIIHFQACLVKKCSVKWGYSVQRQTVPATGGSKDNSNASCYARETCVYGRTISSTPLICR